VALIGLRISVKVVKGSSREIDGQKIGIVVDSSLGGVLFGHLGRLKVVLQKGHAALLNCTLPEKSAIRGDQARCHQCRFVGAAGCATRQVTRREAADFVGERTFT
jgi:hypothetical protein